MSDEEAPEAPDQGPARAIVVGPGRIGLTLAEGLHSAATHGAVQVVGRGSEPPAFLADWPGISYRAAEGWTPPPGSGPLELFLAVPDRSLEEVAEEWSRRLSRSGAGAARAFHTSGARPPDVLRPLAVQGAEIAVLHPLRAVPVPRAGGFSGAWFGIAGSEEGLRRTRELVAALGGRTLRIRDGASTRYHAAAVMASNLLAGCLLLARGELAAVSDASPAEAGEALVDLARSALDAARREGGGEGLTGPLARGELETVARHLSALDSSVRDAYAGVTRALARRVLEMEPEALARLDELERVPTRSGQEGED